MTTMTKSEFVTAFLGRVLSAKREASPIGPPECINNTYIKFLFAIAYSRLSDDTNKNRLVEEAISDTQNWRFNIRPEPTADSPVQTNFSPDDPVHKFLFNLAIAKVNNQNTPWDVPELTDSGTMWVMKYKILRLLEASYLLISPDEDRPNAVKSFSHKAYHSYTLELTKENLAGNLNNQLNELDLNNLTVDKLNTIVSMYENTDDRFATCSHYCLSALTLVDRVLYLVTQ